MEKFRKTQLLLQDGTIYDGYGFGSPNSAAGEVVFNTSMTGYIESLTDPSYTGQILILTFPLIGNYGVPSEESINSIKHHFESDKIHVKGLIISNYSFDYSHWSAVKSLSDWLDEFGIPGIYAIDTRALTKKIRENGTMLGKIVNKFEPEFYNPDEHDLVKEVTTSGVEEFGSGKNRILLVDCGAKNNIIRCLLQRDTTVIKVPYDYDYSAIEYDGIMLSNGPGNPKKCETTISHLEKSLRDDRPIFGICLGNQLLGLASGADTFKLKYGHRSHNQPVMNLENNHAYITSQNHGFAIDESSLSQEWKPLFKNLNDGTIEGIKHVSKPFFSTQFHPEASSGPTDTEYLFDEFVDLVKKYKGAK